MFASQLIHGRGFAPRRAVRRPQERGVIPSIIPTTTHHHSNDMTKFVFVTGGVVSSLGKGIASASLAAILESRGLKVTLIKLDPYINVDPGTMSPFQHGEVFVTDDGAETDLGPGPLRAFHRTRMKKSTTSPPARSTSPCSKRAPWRLLGKTVQVIPHVTNEIQEFIKRGAGGGTDDAVDVAICRNRRHRGRHRVAALPGSRAPVEPQARPQQLGLRAPDLPALDCRRRRAQDQAHPAHRAKAAQIGIQPDALLCRADRRCRRRARKDQLFTNVPEWGVISMWDVDTIYKVPRMLHEQGLDGLICDKLRLNTLPPAQALGRAGARNRAPQGEVTIAMVGKYVTCRTATSPVNEALRHAGMKNHARVKIDPNVGFRKPSTAQRRWQTGQVRRHPGARRLRQPRRGRQDQPPSLPVSTRCPTWASAWACRWPPSNTPATSAGLEGANSHRVRPKAKHPVIA